MPKSNLSDYIDAYIVVKGRAIVTGINNVTRRNKELTFKNNDLYRSCISKTNNTFIDNSENLDVVMPKYNLLEYSDNFFMTSGNLWSYYRDEMNDNANENNAPGN